eukprot:jgi/Orpsp1_1/1186717/evm.model.d7180000052762.1
MKSFTIFALACIAVSKVSAECWSEKLGYSCCIKKNIAVILSDSSGKWGIENSQWCGIDKNDDDCWSSDLGYSCCSKADAMVFVEDRNGSWGIENGEWCGILKVVKSNNSTSESVEKTYPKGTGFQFYTQCKNKNHWALTYDDGPTQYADIILDLLKKYDIKATFFVLGNMYIKSNEAEWSRIIKRMDSEGHIIGSHTYSHDDLTSLAPEEIIEDMQKIEDAVYNAIGKRPAFMRPPYGSGNGDEKVMKTLKEFGINAACNWHIDPMDWDNKGDIEYAKKVLGELKGEGCITLNHLQYNGSTAEGIIALATAEIELMLSKGYKPVTMEECLEMSAYK